MSTKILCPKCHDQNTSCPACGGSGARPFAGVTVRTGQTARSRRGSLPRRDLSHHSATAPFAPAWVATCPSTALRPHKRLLHAVR